MCPYVGVIVCEGRVEELEHQLEQNKKHLRLVHCSFVRIVACGFPWPGGCQRPSDVQRYVNAIMDLVCGKPRPSDVTRVGNGMCGKWKLNSL